MNEANADKVLEYWNRTAAGFDTIYTGQKAGWARFLDQRLRRDMYERFDWTLKNSGDLKGKSICDMGCGTGRYVIAYAQGGAQRVLGIDGAPNMISRAEQLIRENGVGERAEVREVAILDSPEDEQFDVTIAVGVFDYTEDPLPYFRKIRAVTRGRFLATFPRYWTWRMPVRRVRLGMLGCPVYFYTRSQVKALLEKAGFVSERIDRVGKIFCSVARPESKATT